MRKDFYSLCHLTNSFGDHASSPCAVLAHCFHAILILSGHSDIFLSASVSAFFSFDFPFVTWFSEQLLVTWSRKFDCIFTQGWRHQEYNTGNNE